MEFKSLTFTLEITIGTFQEEYRTNATIKEFADALTEAGDDFTKNVAVATNGVFIGSTKLVKHSEDWQ